MKKIALLIITTFTLTACAGMTDTQQRTATGALGGAATGAIIGAIAGNAGMGAAAGTAGGFLYGKHKEAEQKAYQQGLRDAQRH